MPKPGSQALGCVELSFKGLLGGVPSQILENSGICKVSLVMNLLAADTELSRMVGR